MAGTVVLERSRTASGNTLVAGLEMRGRLAASLYPGRPTVRDSEVV
ncbi:MAG: hypothetical protein LBU05_05810 [Bifidobacteriaceae bacterium]|nr:hypothetical protein [Bifidobacteriaceae bacterium]